MAAAEGADLLILARDGDRARLGPRSIGPATRFVVDHAPCAVLLARYRAGHRNHPGAAAALLTGPGQARRARWPESSRG
jgi:hypothetical protein